MSPPPALSRRRRLAAVAFDLAPLVAALALALVVALAWLLWRTHAGRDDVRERDGLVAASMLAAVPPAWVAWLAPGILEGATPGQRRAGLAVEARSTAARLIRAAAHPLAVVPWAWLTVAMLALDLRPAAVAFGVDAALVTLGGLASIVLWGARPGARALHDRLAGTRLVLASPAGVMDPSRAARA